MIFCSFSTQRGVYVKSAHLSHIASMSDYSIFASHLLLFTCPISLLAYYDFLISHSPLILNFLCITSYTKLLLMTSPNQGRRVVHFKRRTTFCEKITQIKIKRSSTGGMTRQKCQVGAKCLKGLKNDSYLRVPN